MPANNNSLPHQGQKIYTTGKPLTEARAAMILMHGRGATAVSILDLAHELYQADFAYLAPQAPGNTWYPYSFLTPISKNEPGLSSGLKAVTDVVALVEEAGIPAAKIMLAGFSQGACLAAEFAARNTRRYGGLLIFSGGLIGPPGTLWEYAGSLDGTPIFLGCSDVDFHSPLERVAETAETLANLGGVVNQRIYPGMEHTIIQDEIDQARQIVDAVLS